MQPPGNSRHLEIKDVSQSAGEGVPGAEWARHTPPGWSGWEEPCVDTPSSSPPPPGENEEVGNSPVTSPQVSPVGFLQGRPVACWGEGLALSSFSPIYGSLTCSLVPASPAEPLEA